jgi:hypothetical protein
MLEDALDRLTGTFDDLPVPLAVPTATSLPADAPPFTTAPAASTG